MTQCQCSLRCVSSGRCGASELPDEIEQDQFSTHFLKLTNMAREPLAQLAKQTIRFTKLIFTPLAVGCLLYFAWSTRNQIQAIASEVQIPWLVASLIAWSSLHFISPIFTNRIFAAISAQISYRGAFLIHSQRLPAKYLPGGIWHSVARATDYHQLGYGKTTITIYLLLENLLAAAVSLTIGAGMVATLDRIDPLFSSLALAILLCGGLLLIWLPLLINKHVSNLPRTLHSRFFYQGVFCLMLYWAIAAIAFVCFLCSVPGINIGVNLLEAGGIYIFSWGVGFVTVFAPQGIGISELVSANLLNSGLSARSFVVLLASFRLVSLAGDLLVWFISLLNQPVNKMPME